MPLSIDVHLANLTILLNSLFLFLQFLIISVLSTAIGYKNTGVQDVWIEGY